MVARVQMKPVDGDWRVVVSMVNGFLAAKAVEKMAAQAKAKGLTVQFRVVKDEDKARRSKEEEYTTLLFAETADEIEHVYKTGPYSCMSGREAYQNRAYAGPDLAVAYLKVDGVIIARTLVWPAKKVHSRLYGDATHLDVALKKAGYKQSGYYAQRGIASEPSFDGARMTKWPRGGTRYSDTDANIFNNYFVPCMEHGCNKVVIDGDFLVMKR